MFVLYNSQIDQLLIQSIYLSNFLLIPKTKNNEKCDLIDLIKYYFQNELIDFRGLFGNSIIFCKKKHACLWVANNEQLSTIILFISYSHSGWEEMNLSIICTPCISLSNEVRYGLMIDKNKLTNSGVDK